MRVLVCGGRGYADKRRVWEELDLLALKRGWLTIIEGGATGADRHARAWAAEHYHGLVTVKADWHLHGTAAGPIRNRVMLTKGKPDMGLSFPGGRGTADMVEQMRAAGVEVKEIK